MMRVLLSVLVLALFGAGTAQAADTSGPNAYAAELGLLEQRVGTLSAQVTPGVYPIASTNEGELITVGGSDWNSGFWSGTLWRLADLTGSAAHREAALGATIDHFGFEGTKLHDLGFMYGESSQAAYDRLCRTGSARPECARLKSSTRKAARTLYALAQTTGQKIIPMSARDCSDCGQGSTETIVDSMMNLPLLHWMARTDGQKKYRDLARRHSDWVAKNLQRSDGSTYQAGRYARSAEGKRVRVLRHTHQGRSNTSVWARGQAWSIYGFALAGREFRSGRYLAIAEKNANYVRGRLSAGGTPPWDYRAPKNAPVDVSAGVITAAGLFHLAAACKAVKRGCKHASRWAPLARTVLSGSLSQLSTAAPVGFLGNQVYRYKFKAGRRWERNAELVLGLDYALEAIRLAREST